MIPVIYHSVFVEEVSIECCVLHNGMEYTIDVGFDCRGGDYELKVWDYQGKEVEDLAERLGYDSELSLVLDLVQDATVPADTTTISPRQ